MSVVLYSTASFLKSTFQEVDTKHDKIIVGTQYELFEVLENKENDKLIFHIDVLKQEGVEFCKILLKEYPNLNIIVLRNVTDFIEGCSLLQAGIKAYGASMSNHLILAQMIKSVNKGNVWIYPELMQFMINAIPRDINKQNALLDTLTGKEKNVALLVSDGLSNAKIAETLGISDKTVKKHITAIFEKLEVKDRLSLALLIKGQ